MKKETVPPTDVQVLLTAETLERAKKFMQRHRQCREEDGGKFELFLAPAGGKPTLVCINCVHQPKSRIPFTGDEFEALAAFVKGHKCKKGKKAVSLRASYTNIGMFLEACCTNCGKRKEISTSFG